MISVWLIVVLFAANITNFLLDHSAVQLGRSIFLCGAYFALLYLVIHGYYLIKHGKFQPLLNEKLGLGDVLVCGAIGCCVEGQHILWFFTTAFILSIFIHLFFFKKDSTIALAGHIAICYAVFVFTNSIYPLELYFGE